jgi:FAD-linked oxidoreductase
MKRRNFLQGSLVLGASASVAGISGCVKEGSEPQTPVTFKPGEPMPWINWAGNESCSPQWRHNPSSEDELVEALKAAKGKVRAVGSGHSFSALVPTDDTLISTDLLSGLINHNPDTLEATLLSGTRLHQCGQILESIGQAMPNIPDMDYPSLGGALATSVHGTGNEFPSMSAYVTGLKLATATGEIIACSNEKKPEIFKAAQAHIGSLGVISEFTLQNQVPFKLTEVNKVEPLEDMLDDIENRCKQHRHFELYAIPHSKMGFSVATDIAKPEDKNIGEEDAQAINTLRTVFDSLTMVPFIGTDLYDRALQTVLGGQVEQVRTGRSYDVLPHVRIVRFREMEYTVPAEMGPICLREIMQTIKDKKLPYSFPLEYRYVKGDDIWLSMFEGQDGCSISVHQYGDIDYRPIFAEIEPIFWKYQGRPHWGKIHTLDAKRLAQVYPRHWQDFQEVRKSLDPKGKFLNAHLKNILGE